MQPQLAASCSRELFTRSWLLFRRCQLFHRRQTYQPHRGSMRTTPAKAKVLSASDMIATHPDIAPRVLRLGPNKGCPGGLVNRLKDSRRLLVIKHVLTQPVELLTTYLPECFVC